MRRVVTCVIAAAVGVMSCQSEEGARREFEQIRDEINADIAAADSARPFSPFEATLGGRRVVVNFDLECRASRTVASLMAMPLEGSRWSEYLVTDQARRTTLVSTQVDDAAPVEEQWLIGPAHIESPMSVTLGRRIEGARNLRMVVWSSRGDSTVLVIPVHKAAPRLRQVARECRWP